MWKKKNAFALLAGMYIGAGTVESSMEITQKIKNGTPQDPAIPFLKNPKILIQKSINTPMFIAA